MRGGRMAGPDRAGFGGRLVADGEDEIHLLGAILCKLVPAFRPREGCVVAELFQQQNRMRIDLAARLRPGGKPLEPALAELVDNRFAQNGAGGIGRAKKQHVINLVAHASFPCIDARRSIRAGDFLYQRPAQFAPPATAIFHQKTEQRLHSVQIGEIADHPAFPLR